jgi:MoaA/NifB/PqqE/SkfB family radical SAM enzyme/Flp pilus assembly protein TadD
MRNRLRIDLTDNCNIRCIQCQAHATASMSEVHFLDFETFVNHTKGQLRDWTYIQLGHVAEPTIHPRFAEILRYIRSESDATIHLVTNGKTLGKHIDVINECSCLLNISMDSVVEETHEYIRHGSNYQRLVDALDRADLERVEVLLSFTMMRSNVDEYAEALQFAKERGYIVGAFPMILREAYGTMRLDLVQESLLFCKDKLDAWLKDYYGKDYGGMVRGAASGTTNLQINTFSCTVHESDLGIDACGNTSICFMQPLPNFNTASLTEIFNSAEAQEFRARVDADREPCVNCDHRKRCLAPSMTLAENHLSRGIFPNLSEETLKAIAFDSNLSDDEKIRIFLKDISRTYNVCHITHVDGKSIAVPVTDFDAIGSRDSFDPDTLLETTSDVIEANSDVELIAMIRKHGRCTDTAPETMMNDHLGYRLSRYMGSFWAVPHGIIGLRLQSADDRAKPEVACHDSLDKLKELVKFHVASNSNDSIGSVMGALQPCRLDMSYPGYDLISYGRRIHAVPTQLGDIDITQADIRNRDDVLATDTPDAMIALLDILNGKTSSLPTDWTAEAYTDLGIALYQHEHTHLAETALRRAVDGDAGCAQAHEALANAMWDAGRTDEALAILRKGLEGAPDSKQLKLVLATALLESEQAGEAIALLQGLSKEHPADIAIRQQLAWAHVKTGTAQAAEDCFREALEIAPNSASLCSSVALFYSQVDHPEEALTWANRAMDLDSENPEVVLNYAVIEFGNGSGQSAINLLESYLKISDSEDIRAALSEMQKQL